MNIIIGAIYFIVTIVLGLIIGVFDSTNGALTSWLTLFFCLLSMGLGAVFNEMRHEAKAQRTLSDLAMQRAAAEAPAAKPAEPAEPSEPAEPHNPYTMPEHAPDPLLDLLNGAAKPSPYGPQPTPEA